MKVFTKLSHSLANLLSELASAVRSEDRRRATQLAQTILRCQSTKTADRTRIERNVRSLLAILEKPNSRHGVPSIPTYRNPWERSFKAGRSKTGVSVVVKPGASGSKADRIMAGRLVRHGSSGSKTSDFKADRITEGRSKTGDSVTARPWASSSKLGRFMVDRSKSGVSVVVRHGSSGSKTSDFKADRITEGRSKTGDPVTARPWASSSKLGRFMVDRSKSGVSVVVRHGASSSKTSGSKTGRIMEGRSKSSKADGLVYPVWFGTNRKQEVDGRLGTKLNDHTIKGRADVYIPKAHRFGETGNAFWKRLLRWDLRDDHLRVLSLRSLKTADFFSEINQEMQAAREKGETPHALFFLHGFNVTFEEAAIRAAQIGCDLKVAGATAFFSWPSFGDVSSYPADEARIEASEGAITDFLVEFSANCGADKVHVIAHSMGNRGLLRALQRIAANAETQGKVKFGQIFLAAPDVDRSLFIDLARLYAEHAERTTLYASNSDKAVHLSAVLHAAPRAGYYTPYTVVPGIDTVAVPDFDIDLLGHSYFAQAEALLHDIHDLMRHGEAPSKRQRIEPVTCDGISFWRLLR